ncbi:hypothetical protein COU57_03070 [Candidatus Pacearchaeota archaeon CG10_big_fil_rev_8_21_14_0_10_32_14]|nr:MAG: hypothetical protein COU57_03070 [Candidatus Pacearchaeota archaeon CG10_big_fil_rev_8_21_14_0_10_32_14]
MKKSVWIGIGVAVLVILIILFLFSIQKNTNQVEFETDYDLYNIYQSDVDIDSTISYASFVYEGKNYSILVGNMTVISYDKRLSVCSSKCGDLSTHNKCANDCMAGYIDPGQGPYSFFSYSEFKRDNPKIIVNGDYNSKSNTLYNMVLSD